MLIAEVAQVEPVATADLRTGAIEQLDSILEGYSNKVYTKENQQLIDQAYADAQAEINNAVSKEAMDEIVAEFANEISQIEATSDFVVGLIFIACAVVAVGGLIFFIHMAGLPNINDPKPEDEE